VGDMSSSEASTYLTERLRELEPDAYERELVRRARKARRVGIFLGCAGALFLCVAVAFAMLHFLPELTQTLLVGG